MIFQDPTAALDPLFTVEQLLLEGLRKHRKMSKKQAREVALESLRMMNLRDPEELMKKKPYELSGGMCQRVMIAIAMSMKPDYLIADEPTTALDVTVQKQILEEIYPGKKIWACYLLRMIWVWWQRSQMMFRS